MMQTGQRAGLMTRLPRADHRSFVAAQIPGHPISAIPRVSLNRTLGAESTRFLR
jgi:hypothetical protein